MAAQISKADGGKWTKFNGDVSISHCLTDTSSPDWALRAFVFGSTSFALDANLTTFVIDASGNRSIVGGAMRPYDTNFDLDSDSKLAAAANFLVFKNLLDPYSFGRTVWFDFTAEQKDAYAQAHSGDTYTISDRPSSLVEYVSQLGFPFTIPLAAANALANSAAVIAEISGGADYIHDNRNVVFGVNGGSVLSRGSGKGTLYDPDLSDIYVGGDGTDVVTITGDDMVYSGAGDDVIVVAHGIDEYEYASALISTGEGADDVLFSTAGNSGSVHHQDVWVDADFNDEILFNFEPLGGGTRAMSAHHANFLVIGDGPFSDHFRFINADDLAMYELDPDSSPDLKVSFAGGGSLFIEDYQHGEAGLLVPPSETIFLSDLEAQHPSMRGAIFEIVEGTMRYQGIQQLHVEYISVDM